MLKRLPGNEQKPQQELEQQAAQNLAERQQTIDDIKRGTLRWQGGDLTKIIEAQKILSDESSTPEQKQGARDYVEHLNAASEANRQRAQYYRTAPERADARAARTEANQVYGGFNRVRAQFQKVQTEAEEFSRQADAQTELGDRLLKTHHGKAKAEAAYARAETLLAKSRAARQQADALRESLTSAGRDAENYPSSLRVTWGEDGTPSVQRAATKVGSEKRQFTPPPSRSNGPQPAKTATMEDLNAFAEMKRKANPNYTVEDARRQFEGEGYRIQ
jgi:hypothetical protein